MPDPALIKDLLDEMTNVDLLCPNQGEAAALVGFPVDTIDDAKRAAEILVRRGAKHAIITMAGQGAVLHDGKAAWWIEPTPVQAVDTTAAGDAFAGAIAVRWAAGDSLVEAARFASVAGAICATRHGAQPAIATAQEIQQRL